MENEAKENVKKLMRECFEMARDGAYTSRGFLYEDFDEYFDDIKDEFNSVVSKRESKSDEAEHIKLTLAGVSNNEAFKCDKCKDAGIYFFSDRVPEKCECKSEVSVCEHDWNSKSQAHAICRKCGLINSDC